MNIRPELIERVARHRRDTLGTLSDAAYQELLESVKQDVESFIDSPEDEAFRLVVEATEREQASRKDEDLLDDDAFFESRTRRMARLVSDCEEALRIDPNCLDAQLLALLGKDLDPDPTIDPLFDVEKNAEETLAKLAPPEDAWNEVLFRPLLRIKACLARTLLDSACYRLAAQKGEEAIALSPSDPLGARHTCSLCYARLEDESSFDSLDVRFSRQGSAWSHLGRALLLYKIDRMPAARRAIKGYARTVEGGAYALLRPVMVDSYLPGRPECEPLSYPEAMLAVHEADPIICDVPDFPSWAQNQRDLWCSAQDFAQRKGFDW